MGKFMDAVTEDLQFGGNIATLAYVVYFINDQLFGLVYELHERYGNTPYYKFESKRLIRRIAKEVNRVATSRNEESKGQSYDMADVLVRMEEQYKPLFDGLLNQAKALLAQLGYSEEQQDFLSRIYGLLVLSRANQYTVDFIQRLFHKTVSSKYMPMDQDRVNQTNLLSGKILVLWMGEEHAGRLLSGTEEMNDSIYAFSKKLFNREGLLELLASKTDNE